MHDQMQLVSSQSIYVKDSERFVVMLAVSYDAEDLADPTADEAAESALELTRDGGHADTMWVVLDRETGSVQHIEQGDFDGRMERPRNREKRKAVVPAEDQPSGANTLHRESRA